MDIRDFEGLTKYKIIVPVVYIISWISLFLGPYFYPVPYQNFTIAILLLIIINVSQVFFGMIKILIQSS